MKKTLLLAALLLGSLSQLSAQCAITPTCSIGVIGYCTSPAENTSLPNGTELVSYSSSIQLSLGTTVAGLFTISDASISGVTGLPSGFTYSINPSSGTILAGSDACLIIAGIPAAASAGTYTINVGFNVNTSFTLTTQTLVWNLTIDPTTATSIKSVNQSNQLFLAPNPVTNDLFISSASHIGKIQIMDALGKTVMASDANYSTYTTIHVGDLAKGVYFIQVSDGSKLITRKFIKE